LRGCAKIITFTDVVPWRLKFILLALVFSFASCSLFSYSKPADFDTPQRVLASYYGYDCDGRKTANGELFNPYGLTAAHRTLPFGTRLKVRNPQNGREVIVRINDRGPYISGREIDLSYGAAVELGIVHKGLTAVDLCYY
jgi:rare lipoprotein A (peptidoglycan hydrolase)